MTPKLIYHIAETRSLASGVDVDVLHLLPPQQSTTALGG